MSEQLQHDPRTKQQIKDLLYEFLYRPVQNKYQEKLHQIIQANSRVLNSTQEAFIYRGETYSVNPNIKLPRRLNRLVPQLHPLMNEYLGDIKQLNKQEIPYTLGYINKVLNTSNNLPDYLKLLPESVHQPIKDLIATCPCHNSKLNDEQVQAIQASNESSIELMKQRMVLNLLL